MKKVSALFLGLLVAVLFAGVASAHVTVQPRETTQGTYEVFTVRVPTEKDVPTVKVEVKIPEEVTISRFEPKPDWEYELDKDDTGKIVSVAWTATGGGLSSTEFGEFKMNGRVADDADAIAWKAYQTYEDGSVVEWVGAEGSDTPASVTQVRPKPEGAAADSHGSSNGAAAAGSDAGGGGGSPLTLSLSIAALVISLLALLLAVRKRGK